MFLFTFFSFSSFSAQIANRFDKASLIRKIKLAEIVIMFFGALGIYFQNGFLLCVLFLMGAQSTLFGPIKYSILPGTLAKNELVAGNAFLEAATFVAILCGSMLGIIIDYLLVSI